MRLRGAAAFLALLVVVPGAPSAVRAASSATPDATLGAPVSGTSQYVDGTYVWTDYAYDDRLSTYPAGTGNSADLVQLQIAIDDAGDLHLKAVLETLTDPSVPLLAVGVDSDLNSATGSAHLLGMLGLTTTDDLGIEREFLVDASGTTVFTFDSQGGHEENRFGSTIDPSRNTIEADVPSTLAGADGPGIRVFAMLGLRSKATAFDLAFVGGEPSSGWQSARQASVVSGGAARDASAVLDLDKMRAAVTEAPDASSPGFHTFLYHSDLALAEGIQPWNLRGPGGAPLPLGNFYAGPYQPYIVWVPDRPLPEHPPLVVYMHGLQGTHTSNVNTLGKGLIDPDAIVVMPLGRGEDSFYEREAEQDILDVTDDAMARFDVDPDRVVLSGISMGGFGAFRLGILRPDRWSAIVPLIGTADSAQMTFGAAARPEVFSPSGFPSGVGEMMENLLNVPVRMVNGQVDPIVNNAFVTQDVARLTQLQYDFKSWVLMRRQHEVVPSISDCVFDEAVAMKRDGFPKEIAFSSEPATFVTDQTTGLDLRYTSAYWLRRVTARDPERTAVMHIIDAADPLGTAPGGPIAGADENFSHGADLCGPNGGIQTQDAWRLNGVARTRIVDPAPRDQIAIWAFNTSMCRLDLTRHGIIDHPISLDVTTDGATTLELEGLWLGPVRIDKDGEELAVVEPDDHVVRLQTGSDALVSGALGVTLDSTLYTITPL